MTRRWPPSGFDPLLAEIGRIVFNFNTLERNLKTLLWVLASRDGNDQIHHVLTAHLGNVALTDALSTVATEFYSSDTDSDMNKAVQHVVEVFDLTREYRNWYIHGFGSIKFGGLGELRGLSAKKRLVDHRQTFTVKEAAWLADWCYEASVHSAKVYCYCAERFGRLPPDDPPRTLPEKLQLPDRLTKPRQHRLGDKPQPQP